MKKKDLKWKWMRLVNLLMPSLYEDSMTDFSRVAMYEKCKKGLIVETKEDFYENFLKECRRDIRDRVRLHHFHKTIKVPEELCDDQTFSKIWKYFEDLGFTVINMMQVSSGEIANPYLFIYWGESDPEYLEALKNENTISE